MQLVSTPTADWLKARLPDCASRFWVASPFVTGYLKDVTGDMAATRDCRLVTNTDIRIFLNKASDLDTLDELEANGVKLKSVNRLHAKAYVIDEKFALVTSANATHSGMYRNRECGIATDDPGVVREIADLIVSGFGVADGPQDVTKTELAIIRGLVGQFKPQSPAISMQGFAEEEPPPFMVKDSYQLLSQLSGWLALTMEGVMALKSDTFTMDDLDALCTGKAAERYPENKHVRAKLRQQLQRLRDLGLVEFVDDKGEYRRLFSAG